jgi:ribosomal protein L40E
MTERVRRPTGTATQEPTGTTDEAAPRSAPDASEAKEAGREGEAAERALGRAVALGLPVVSVLAAITVGLIASVGSGLLVLASGALLGAIALLWASVRTLSGDAPLPVGLERLAAQTHHVDALDESKRRVLRALKDLENEHAIGRIDDADYDDLAAKYRQEAKALMREMDQNAAPGLAEAERVAREYLAKRGLGMPPNPAKGDTRKSRTSFTTEAAEPSEIAATSSDRLRVACARCGTSNEADATFCKKCGAAVQPGTAGTKESDATS